MARCEPRRVEQFGYLAALEAADLGSGGLEGRDGADLDDGQGCRHLIRDVLLGEVDGAQGIGLGTRDGVARLAEHPKSHRLGVDFDPGRRENLRSDAPNERLVYAEALSDFTDLGSRLLELLRDCRAHHGCKLGALLGDAVDFREQALGGHLALLACGCRECGHLVDSVFLKRGGDLCDLLLSLVFNNSYHGLDLGDTVVKLLLGALDVAHGESRRVEVEGWLVQDFQRNVPKELQVDLCAGAGHRQVFSWLLQNLLELVSDHRAQIIHSVPDLVHCFGDERDAILGQLLLSLDALLGRCADLRGEAQQAVQSVCADDCEALVDLGGGRVLDARDGAVDEGDTVVVGLDPLLHKRNGLFLRIECTCPHRVKRRVLCLVHHVNGLADGHADLVGDAEALVQVLERNAEDFHLSLARNGNAELDIL